MMSPSFLGFFAALLVLVNAPGSSLALPEEKSVLRSTCTERGGICTTGEGLEDCFPIDEDNSVLGCDVGLTCCWIKPAKKELKMPMDERSLTCSGMDGTYTDPTGYIGIYGNYTNNENCTWEIIVEAGYVVHLQWQFMDVEYVHTCYWDGVEIIDGSGAYLGKYCGRGIIPLPITSVSNVVKVVFTSDSIITGTGFEIYYETTLTATATPPPESSCSAYDGLQTCIKGKVILRNYTNYESCRWEIRVDDGKIIRMNWKFLDIEYHEDCIWDSVQVTDLVTGDILSGPLCGDIAPSAPFFSSSNSVEVVFTSDSIITANGFVLKYKAVNP